MMCDERHVRDVLAAAGERAGARGRITLKPSADWNRFAALVTELPRAAHQPGGLPGALLTLGDGRHHLGEGFALRCCQRFSLPDVATGRCPWQDNPRTSGPSAPVLSY